MFNFDFLIDITHITSADAFPSTIVQQRDVIAVNAVNLIPVAIHGIPVFSLLDKEIAIPEHKRRFVRIAVHFATGTMVYIPIAGIALQRHIAERIIIDILAVNTAYEPSVFIGEIPDLASSDAITTIIKQVDLIAVEDG